MKKTETDFQQTQNDQEEVSRKHWSTEYPLITSMLFHLIGRISHIVYLHFVDGVTFGTHDCHLIDRSCSKTLLL